LALSEEYEVQAFIAIGAPLHQISNAITATGSAALYDLARTNGIVAHQHRQQYDTWLELRARVLDATYHRLIED
jgi:hypothetical protein